MNIEYLATPIYQRALLYVTALHALAGVSALFLGGLGGLALFVLAVIAYLAALAGSLISLAVFKILLAKVDPTPPSGEVYNSIHLRALASLAAGALATIVVLCGVMGSPEFMEAGWWYMLFPVSCTWLAVFQKRKTIYKAIRKAEALHHQQTGSAQ